ncbi:hypothetical protein [Halobacterium sp. BOL4-2]|uniref:hypothetical protein n=1 Tax=Halobacterium sp. BOL4-2 TaxID=2810537 RepID=UPI0019663F22|nr:hypothetical protein [Halobacterium sp. BOL4-2]QRY26352.1 hypothetical protein JRZ79_13250 [Halobacterium sp. BOL4-2]
MRRRQYLAALAMTGLAGCSTTSSSDTTTETTLTETQTTQSPTPTESPTETSTQTRTESSTETSTETSTREGTTTAEPTVEPGIGNGPGEYDRTAVRQQATTTTCTAIERVLDGWVGKAVHLEYARVADAVEDREDDQDEEYQFMRLYSSPDGSNWNGDLAGHYYGPRPIDENDYLEVWGVVEGEEEYESAAGVTKTGAWVTVVIAGPRDGDEISNPPY